MNRFSCRKYQIARTLLLAALLLAGGGPGATAVWAQSAVVISVKALCAKGDYEWQGLVSDSMARHNPELRALLAELRKAQEKAAWSETLKDEQQADKDLAEASANLEKMKKEGFISDTDYQRIKKDLADSRQQRKVQANTARQLPGVSNPAALKESLRKYCFGRRFYSDVLPLGNGVIRVTGTVSGGKGQEKTGFMDAAGKMIIPMEYFRLDAPARFGNEMLVSGIKEGRCGVLTLKNEIVIPFIYESAGFHADMPLFFCKKNGKRGALNRTGKTVIPFIYKDILRHNYYTKNPAGTCTVLIGHTPDGKNGIYDLSGRELVPGIYTGLKLIEGENRIACIRAASGGGKVCDIYELCSWVKLEEGKPFN